MSASASYQVAIIGGGITGASAANHLAAAGFSTILLERGDFASGTSGRSSRLQHCGLTYFSPGRSIWNFLRHPRMAVEHLELARRAMRDRSRFVRETPERVRAIPFYVPLYRSEGITAWKARLGFRLLERLDPGGVPLDFVILSPTEALREPALSHLRDQKNLCGVLRFTEYQFDWPERICIDTILNARDAGAVVRNYTEVTTIRPLASRRWQIDIIDHRAPGGAVSQVTADCIINAAGAWVDDVAARCDANLPKVNQGLKGTNTAVRLPEQFRGVAIETALPNGSPFYLIPWGDLHYFGPRDEPCEATPENFRADEATIRALLDDFNTVFPTIPLTREDVIYSWAGVRPRTARHGLPEGSEAVLLHDMTRAGQPLFYTYTGGLLMTHRAAGSSIARAVAGRMRAACATQSINQKARLAPPPPTGEPCLTSGDLRIAHAELRRIAREEMTLHLDDLLFRRTRFGWSEGMGLDIVEEAAETVADIHGWGREDVTREVAQYRDFVAAEFGRDPSCT